MFSHHKTSTPNYLEKNVEWYLYFIYHGNLYLWPTFLHTTCFLSVIFCVVWGLWVVAIPRNGALRQWFIVATIRGDFCLLKSLLAGINTTIHRYRPYQTYPCVVNMKRRTYPHLLVDFYDASQFEMINFANVKIQYFYSDPVSFLFGNMQIMSIYGKWRHLHKQNRESTDGYSTSLVR